MGEQGAEVRRGAPLLALTRPAVVGGEHDDGVVPLPHGLEFGSQPSEVLVHVVDHARVDLLIAGEDLALHIGEVVPGFDGMVRLGVAGWQDRTLGDDPQFLLAFEAALPDDVPAVRVVAPVLLGVGGPDLERGVGGAM
jgi:hypothetical protein